MAKRERGGRIYVDYLRNGMGATAVAAYSTRARPGAAVSTPLAWDELGPEIRANHFTVENLPKRLAFLDPDPWAGISSLRQELPAAEAIPKRQPATSSVAAKAASAVAPESIQRRLPDAVVPSKGALIAYWKKIAKEALEYLGRRPLKLVRHAAGKTFFHQGPLPPVPEAVHQLRVETRAGGEGVRLWVDSLDGLLGLLEIGVVELHPWGATVDDIERPDTLVFALEPDDGIDWKFVAETALRMRDVLKTESLDSWPKLTGTGVHVMVPVVPDLDWNEAHGYSEGIALDTFGYVSEGSGENVFVVRDGRPAPFLYQQSVSTDQAYNNYPNDGRTGKSLYDFNSYGVTLAATGYKSAAKVSFDRPYLDGGINEDFYSDTGEVNYIRWLEKSGYDVTYQTDVDTHANGGRLLNYRGFLSVGHDEYWSKQMYDAVVAARDGGVNVGFFGANAVYWQIRFEGSTGGVANRVIVCYKDYDRDPITDQSLKTINWRDAPVNRPEQTLIGVQYTPSSPPQNQQGFFVTYVVNNSSNWVYAGTGFRDGDTVIGLVGYEADRRFSDYPAPTAIAGTSTLLSRSPWGSGTNDYSNSSVYQAPSGAWVFATGTMDWNWALDDYGHGYNVVDARIQRTTANVLDKFIANAQPDFSVAVTPSSQVVAPGGSTSYAVSTDRKGGFVDPVTLTVTGLPSGATGTFAPNPTTGSSTLSVTTNAATPIGVYTLTITGVAGSLTRTSTTTLTVSLPDFALSATPSSRTVTPGSPTSYSVTIAPLSGFSGQVTLSVSGLLAEVN
jgi:DNA primase